MANHPTTTEHFTTIPGRKRDRARLIKRFPGMLSYVANKLKIQRGQVGLVFHKKETSARATAALIAELNIRVDNEHKAEASKGNGGD